MSYTPDNQLLEPGLSKTIEGIEETCSAIQERINCSYEWKPEHLNEIQELSSELHKLKLRLLRLKKNVR